MDDGIDDRNGNAGKSVRRGWEPILQPAVAAAGGRRHDPRGDHARK